MKAAHVVLSAFGLIAATACLDVTSNSGSTNSEIRVVNATGQFLGLYVDHQLAIDNSGQLNISLLIAPSGPHTISLRTASGVDTDVPIESPPGGSLSIYAYTQGGVVNAVLLDTAPQPAATKIAVRFLNLSTTATTRDAYFSYLDGSEQVTVATPFSYLLKTPFMTLPPGTYHFFTTQAGTSTVLKMSDSLQIPPGERRTVIMIDSTNGPTFRLLPN